MLIPTRYLAPHSADTGPIEWFRGLEQVLWALESLRAASEVCDTLTQRLLPLVKKLPYLQANQELEDLWSNWGVEVNAELRGQLAPMPASKLAVWIRQSESATALRVVLCRIREFNERHVRQAMHKLEELARDSGPEEIAGVAEMARGVAEWGYARYGGIGSGVGRRARGGGRHAGWYSDANVNAFLREKREGAAADQAGGGRTNVAAVAAGTRKDAEARGGA